MNKASCKKGKAVKCPPQKDSNIEIFREGFQGKLSGEFGASGKTVQVVLVDGSALYVDYKVLEA